ncbi:MAG: VPS10 domain-containing protein, partial [Bacteroidia bacterium]
VDGGTSWTALSAFATNYNWIRLAVTPANPAKLAVQFSTGTKPFYVSTNYGANLTYISDCPEASILYISPTDQNKIYCGSVYVYQSTNGGANWNMITYWYNNPPYDEVHADQRNIASHPLNPDLIYFCNDGGLYSYSESTTNWVELSNGLIITQFYKIAISQTDPMMMLGGTQDNGGRLRMGNGLWRAINGGDAMHVAIDPTDDDVIYTTYVNGKLYRSLDRWTNDVYYEISANIPGGTPNGSWEAPYMIDPSNSNTLVAGYDDVWRTTDRGNTWTQLSTNITGVGETLECLAVAPSDPNTIYVSNGNDLYKTTNLGGSWTTVSIPGAPNITSIVIHPTNPQEIWITRDGYTASSKVYRSINGGTNWTNISTGLPNSPVNTCVLETGSANLLYVGTDAGVYTRDTLTNTWQSYSTGLPYTSVTDLKIYYPTRKLRAGTYGRGIWEVDLTDPLGTNTSANAETTMSIYPNPATETVTINYTSNSTESVQITVCNVLGETVQEMTNTGMSANMLQFNVAGLAKGFYTVTIVQGETKISRQLMVN